MKPFILFFSLILLLPPSRGISNICLITSTHSASSSYFVKASITSKPKKKKRKHKKKKSAGKKRKSKSKKKRKNHTHPAVYKRKGNGII